MRYILLTIAACAMCIHAGQRTQIDTTITADTVTVKIDTLKKVVYDTVITKTTIKDTSYIMGVDTLKPEAVKKDKKKKK